MAHALDTSRETIVEWLMSRGEGLGPQTSSAEITGRFLIHASRSGFTCEMVPLPDAGYEARWTYQEASFVGFKQPPPQDSANDALLVGCAALLQNEWCRARL